MLIILVSFCSLSREQIGIQSIERLFPARDGQCLRVVTLEGPVYFRNFLTTVKFYSYCLEGRYFRGVITFETGALP